MNNRENRQLDEWSEDEINVCYMVSFFIDEKYRKQKNTVLELDNA